MAFTETDIEEIEGLESIRYRPTMYIGAATSDGSQSARLLECALTTVVSDAHSTRSVRLFLWRERVVTIAWDGEPLPIAPSAVPKEDIPHPALYRPFMTLLVPSPVGWAIVNALSERLVVSTLHDGQRYRVGFRRGGLISLLSKSPTEMPFGTNWMTFRPDAELLQGALSSEQAIAMAKRVSMTGGGDKVITVIDRVTENAN